MKKLVVLFLIALSFNAVAQEGSARLIARATLVEKTGERSIYFLPTLRVLTGDERDSLLTSELFRKKCERAIEDYASFWIGHNGSGLSDSDRFKWRREYNLVKSVWKGDYIDNIISKRFVILGKGRQYNLDNTPTVNEIIALMVADGSFDSIASQYFDMLTQ